MLVHCDLSMSLCRLCDGLLCGSVGASPSAVLALARSRLGTWGATLETSPGFAPYSSDFALIDSCSENASGRIRYCQVLIKRFRIRMREFGMWLPDKLGLEPPHSGGSGFQDGGRR